jgi:hypothetical protein
MTDAAAVTLVADSVPALPTSAGHPSSHSSRPALLTPATQRNPQHNGWDRDADNNGGPSDGDGNTGTSLDRKWNRGNANLR